tara:strand:+ start:84937 stop:85467 length:531 start_codon:yes stop_codon:yes gene_type:complete
VNNPYNENDYNDFLSSEGNQPPTGISKKIVDFVHRDLNPEHKIVFLKLLVIQLFIGLLTLLFCPQFELSLTNNHKLYHYFHYAFGTYGCFAACGALFIGSGAVLASYILKRSEVRKIRTSRFLYFLSISMVAVSFFLLFGANIYFTAAGAWLIGAVLGGLSMFELNSYFRNSLLPN